jgi:hypothetical protein
MGENSGFRDQLLNVQDYELFRDRQFATRTLLVITVLQKI